MQTAFFLSPWYYGGVADAPSLHVRPGSASVLFCSAIAIAGHIFGLHDPLSPRYFWRTFARCIGATGLALSLFSAVVFALLYSRIGRYMLVHAFFSMPILMALSRRMIWKYSIVRKRRLLLIGAKKIGQSLSCLLERSGLPFEVVAFVDHSPELTVIRLGNNAVLNGPTKLSKSCFDWDIDEVVVCLSEKVNDTTMTDLMECLTFGVKVSLYSQFVERNFHQVPVENIQVEWFLNADIELGHPFYTAVKRGTDIVAALVGGILSAPLLFVAVILIRIESGGGAFYSQTRTGQFNTLFRMWKLRTMRTNAEANGPQWAAKQDSRVTRVGRILRATRIDEIPQLWNILKGEMSLIGPRPERPEFVAELEKAIPFYQQRHLVRPGLTGWAQINYCYGASVEDSLNKLKYDLYYIKYASVMLEVQIVLRTIGGVMKGAR
jgi:exopolysaccharide biosynthesis polyprenyl glycosylphosphotransferase